MIKFRFPIKKIKFEILTAVLVAFICIVTLFVRPIIGMSDNGDFNRIISQSDLYYLQNKDKDEKFLKYFTKDYGIYKYNNENPKFIVSTQLIVTKTVVFISKIFTKNYIFDIRILAFLYILIYIFGAYFIVKTLTFNIHSVKYKIFITILYIFIFCDTGYIAYFNSFYGEATSLSFFLFSLGILFYMCKFKKYSILNLFIFFLSSFIFIGSKQQLAPVGILTAVILFRLFMINKAKSFRYTALGLSMITLLSSFYFYRAISGDFDYINRYHAMTRGVLLYQWDSDKILKEFNINSQYSLLQETIYFNQIPVINPSDDKLKKEFYSKYSFFSILGFYLNNPKVFIKMINFAVINGYSIRPKVIGNYEKREGKTPGSKSYFFSLWSTLKEKYIPHNLFLTLLFFGIYFMLAGKRYILLRKKEDLDLQLYEEVFVYVFLVGVSQIFISILGAGDADLGKHVFMFNVAFDIILLHFVAQLLMLKTEKSKQ